MNAVLNIQVRVMSQEAQAQLKTLQQQMNQMAQGANRAGGSSGTGGFGASLDAMSANLIKSGKNMQWVGRQMEYAFTLPIVAGGAYATKIALENAAATTELAKVYGLLGTEGVDVQGELSQLGTTMELLSDRFGVQQAKVLDVAKAWAEAGSSGVGLARSVQNTLEASVIGTMDLTSATDGLIAVQSAYHMSSTQLRTALADLDLIQVQSGINFQGLIQVVQRAGSTAAVAGIDMQHLAAMAAAIVPAAGTASQAGNALRTIISRIIAPTKDAAKLLGEMGINIDDAKWSAVDGTKRFEMLAQAVSKLPDSQKLVVDSFIAARFQLNRFSALMSDATKQNGFYQTSLRNTADPVKALALYSQQLNTVLSSSPQRLQILKTELQNSLAKVIQPMLPALLGFVERIVSLVTWFSHLNPELQQFIMGGLLTLALVGPILRYVGAFRELGGILVWLLAQVVEKGGEAFVGLTKVASDAYWSLVVVARRTAAIAMDLWAGFISQMMGLWFNLQLSLAGAWTATWGAILRVLEIAAGAIEVVWTEVMSFMVSLPAILLSAWDSVLPVLAGLPRLLLNGWVGLVDFIVRIPYFLANAWEIASAAIVTLWEAAWGGILTLSVNASLFMQEIPDILLRAWISASTLIAAAWETAQAMILSVSVQVSTLLTTVWEAVGGFMIGIPDLLLRAWIAGTNLLAQVWGNVTEFLVRIWGTASDFLMSSWIRVTNFLSFAWEVVGNLLMETWIAVTNFIPVAWQAAQEAVLGLTVWFQTALPAILEAIPRIWATVTAAIETIWRMAMVVMSEETIGFAAASMSTIVEAMGEMVAAIAAAAAIPEEAVVAAIILMVAGVALLLGRFRKNFQDALNSIVQMASKLPGALAQIFGAVVNVVATAMKAVIHWLSYLNPFAHHSPSLVEVVTSGTTVTSQQYKGMAGEIQGHMQTAKAAHQDFQNAVGGTQAGFDAAELQGTRDKIVKQVPSAAPQADEMIKQMVQLKQILHEMDPMIVDQQNAVDGWKAKLDAANDALDQQNNLLDTLKKRASDARDQLDAAKQTLSDYANTPIQGMKAMNDQIFANDQAQKQLRLEIMKLEDAGGSVDDITQKMANLQGQIEKLRGEASDLRAAGAGSDILGPIGDQIAALQAQQQALGGGPGDAINQLQQQLDALQRQGQELDLQNSLQFDPLKRQIDDVTNSMKEMPFDQLMAQITSQKANVDQLQAAWDSANNAVIAQQAVVDQATAARDDVQKSYDAESKKLDALKQSYSDVTDQVDKMKSAMDTLSSSIDKSKSAAADSQSVLDKLMAAPSGPLPDVTGGANIGRETDQSIADFNKQIQDALDQMGKDMAKLDPFKPFKDMFNTAWKWIKDHAKSIIVGTMIVIGAIILEAISLPVAVAVEAIALLLYAIFGPKVFGAIARSFMGIMGDIWRFIVSIWQPIQGVFMDIFHAIGDALSFVWNNVIEPIWNALTSFVTMVVIPVLQAMWAVWQAVWGLVMDILRGAWGFIQPILAAFVGFFHDYILPVLELFGAIVEIVFALVGVVISAAWNAVIYPVLKALWSFLNNDLGSVFHWLYDSVIKPVMDAVGAVISFMWNNVVEPIFSAIWNHVSNILGPVFGWLWHNIIEPSFGAIGTVIETVWNTVIKPAFDGVKWFIENVVAPAFTWLKDNVVSPVFSAIGSIISGVWDGITGAIKASINFVIDVFNTIADIINSIGGALHIGIHVDHMPRIGEKPVPGAGGQGGTIRTFAAGGLVASKAVAIVGEGRAGYPEYVIPTDPQFRQRATYLYRALGAEIAPHRSSPQQVQMLAGGGILGDVAGALGNVVGFAGHILSDIKNDVVRGIVAPMFGAADVLIDHLPDGFFKDIVKHVEDSVYNFVVGIPAAYNGALIRGTSSGVLMRVGERNQSEAIMPLPNNGAGKRELHFHGDLVFPNVKSGDDAEAFIKNLETLAAS